MLVHATGLDLANSEHVVLPKPLALPVPSTPVENGIACNNEGCKYLNMMIKRLERHWVTILAHLCKREWAVHIGIRRSYDRSFGDTISGSLSLC